MQYLQDEDGDAIHGPSYLPFLVGFFLLTRVPRLAKAVIDDIAGASKPAHTLSQAVTKLSQVYILCTADQT